MTQTNPFRPGTMRFEIAKSLLTDKTQDEAYDQLAMLVINGTVVYKQVTADGQREPMPLHNQLEKLKKEISETDRILSERA